MTKKLNNNKHLRVRLIQAFSGTALVLCGGSAFAQIDEIIVTAQKREQSLLDVSQGVQAFSGDEIELRGQFDIEDITKFVPGASVSSTLAPGFDTYQIRGVNSGTQGESTTGFYLDELAFAIPNVQIAPASRLYDLERVEVLRGPQGTLYGLSSMGGTVKVLTKSPDFDGFYGKVQTIGSGTVDGGFNYSLDGALNVPVIEDKFAVRIVGGLEDIEGFAESSGEFSDRNLNDNNSHQFRVKALLAPIEGVTIEGTYWRTDIEQDFADLFVSVDPPVLSPTAGVTGFVDTEWEMFSGVLKVDAGPVSIESATSYLEYGSGILAGFETFGATGSTEFDVEASNLTHETRIVSNSDGPLQWIAGAFYNRGEILSDSSTVVPAFFISDFFRDEIEVEGWAVFGEVSYELLDGLIVPLVGLRYSADDRHLEQTSIGGLFAAPASPPIDLDSSSVNPRFNIAVHPNDDGQIYFNAARGSRGGTFQSLTNVNAGLGVGIQSSVALRPDSLWSYELGTKWNFFDEVLYVEAALYYFDWSEATVRFPIPGQPFEVLVGVGDVVGRGVDLLATWNVPVDGLTLTTTANFNQTEFNDPIASAVAANPALVGDGLQIPDVPKASVSLQANYTSSAEVLGMNPIAYGSYAYRARQTDPTTAAKSEILHDVSLRLGLQNSDLTISVFASNLLDRRGPVVLRGGSEVALRPLTVGMSVNMNLN